MSIYQAKIFVIYMITNLINGKKYIGFSGEYIQRKFSHISLSKNPNSPDYSAIHAAISLYGEENFKWEILYQSYDQENTLKIMEPFFIRLHDSFGENGYNLTEGGDGVLGRIISDEERLIRSINSMGENNPFYGKRHTEKTLLLLRVPKSQETKQKLSKIGKTKTGKLNSFYGCHHKIKTKAKLHKIHAKEYVLTNKNGKIFKICGLKKYCKKRKIHHQGLLLVKRGKCKSYKGIIRVEEI